MTVGSETQGPGLFYQFKVGLLVAKEKLCARFALTVHVGDFERLIAEHLDVLDRDDRVRHEPANQTVHPDVFEFCHNGFQFTGHSYHTTL